MSQWSVVRCRLSQFSPFDPSHDPSQSQRALLCLLPLYSGSTNLAHLICPLLSLPLLLLPLPLPLPLSHRATPHSRVNLKPYSEPHLHPYPRPVIEPPSHPPHSRPTLTLPHSTSSPSITQIKSSVASTSETSDPCRPAPGDMVIILHPPRPSTDLPPLRPPPVMQQMPR